LAFELKNALTRARHHWWLIADGSKMELHQ